VPDEARSAALCSGKQGKLNMLDEMNLLAQIEALKQDSKVITLYAIADPAQDAKLRTQYLPKAKFRNQSSLLDPSDTSEAAATVAPFLVQLPNPSEDAELWKNLIGFAQKTPASLTVLASVHPFAILHKHLSYFTEIRLPDETAMILAYWDPAILGTLMGNKADTTLHVNAPVFTAKQRQALLSPVAVWWYWDRGGNLQRLDNQGSGIALDFENRIKLVQVQVDMLAEASVPDSLVAHLRETQPMLLVGMTSAEQYTSVNAHLLAARQLGLRTMRDLIDYVCAGLIYRDRISTDDAITQLLEKVKNKQLKLAEALEQFP
jgi:hypothetical protein